MLLKQCMIYNIYYKRAVSVTSAVVSFLEIFLSMRILLKCVLVTVFEKMFAVYLCQTPEFNLL